MQQATIHRQRIPRNSIEGEKISHKFPKGSRGLFGSDLPSMWLPEREIKKQYQKVFYWYKIFGDYSLIRSYKITKYMIVALEKILGTGIPG